MLKDDYAHSTSCQFRAQYRRVITFFTITLVIYRQLYPIFSSLLLSCIPGGGPGSWLMHFPYVVLHGIFGKF